MIRQLTILFVVLVLAGGAVRLAAHDEFRIIGTLTKHQDSTIEVKKNNTGKAVPIHLDRQTAITQAGRKVDAKALKVGQSLVVDAYGDAEEYSLAVEIRIVPPIKGGGK
jgi:hypothetical protein